MRAIPRRGQIRPRRGTTLIRRDMNRVPRNMLGRVTPGRVLLIALCIPGTLLLRAIPGATRLPAIRVQILLAEAALTVRAVRIASDPPVEAVMFPDPPEVAAVVPTEVEVPPHLAVLPGRMDLRAIDAERLTNRRNFSLAHTDDFSVCM